MKMTEKEETDISVYPEDSAGSGGSGLKIPFRSRIWGFISKWLNRFHIALTLIGLWGIFFAFSSLRGCRMGIEYDDGLVYSTPAFKIAAEAAAQKEIKDDPAVSGRTLIVPGSTAEFYSVLNNSFGLERTKIVPWLAAWTLKLAGWRVSVFCDRESSGGSALKKNWRRLADDFFFTPSETEKYEILSGEKFNFYAGASDSGLAQAVKAGVKPVRVLKSPMSTNQMQYTPGKFNEKIMRLSQL